MKFEPYFFFTGNPRCFSHVDYWCTFSGVFHVNCFTWKMVYPLTWVSGGYHVENATLFCFTCFPRVFYTRIIGVSIHVYIWWISSDV